MITVLAPLSALRAGYSTAGLKNRFNMFICAAVLAIGISSRQSLFETLSLPHEGKEAAGTSTRR